MPRSGMTALPVGSMEEVHRALWVCKRYNRPRTPELTTVEVGGLVCRSQRGHCLRGIVDSLAERGGDGPGPIALPRRTADRPFAHWRHRRCDGVVHSTLPASDT